MKITKKEIIALCVRVALALALFFVARWKYDSLTQIDMRRLVELAPSVAVACLLILGVYFVKGLVFVVPASLLYVSVGMALNIPLAVTINLIGILIEVTVTYWLGRFLGGEYVGRLLEKNKGGKKLLAMSEKTKLRGILVMRLVPVFPIDFASLFFGSGKTPFWSYIFVSVIGIAPRVVLFTILGDSIYDFIPMALIVKCVITLIPVGIVVYVISFFIKKKKEAKKEVK